MRPYNPTFPINPMPGDRHSIRLTDFDYGQSAFYYVTFCTDGRQRLFGDVVNGQMHRSPSGEIVKEEWLRTPIVRPGVFLDEWEVMPDHFHAILEIDEGIHRGPENVGAHRGAPLGSNGDHSLIRPPRTLGSLVGQFKGVTTHKINEQQGVSGVRIWQRGYFERIIRNEVQLDKFRKYIRNNAAAWRD